MIVLSEFGTDRNTEQLYRGSIYENEKKSFVFITINNDCRRAQMLFYLFIYHHKY